MKHCVHKQGVNRPIGSLLGQSGCKTYIFGMAISPQQGRAMK
jgi:hypothetical protein